MPIELEGALPDVETKRSDLQDGRRGAVAVELRAARLRLDARDELSMPERLDDVVIRTEVECADLVIFGSARSQNEDRHLRASSAQLGEKLESIPGPKIEIDDRKTGMFLLEELECSLGLCRGQWDQPSLIDKERQQVNEILLVVDKQDAKTPRQTVAAHPPASRAVEAYKQVACPSGGSPAMRRPSWQASGWTSCTACRLSRRRCPSGYRTRDACPRCGRSAVRATAREH